jgi:hypothetical protein
VGHETLHVIRRKVYTAMYRRDAAVVRTWGGCANMYSVVGCMLRQAVEPIRDCHYKDSYVLPRRTRNAYRI